MGYIGKRLALIDVISLLGVFLQLCEVLMTRFKLSCQTNLHFHYPFLRNHWAPQAFLIYLEFFWVPFFSFLAISRNC